MQPIQIVIASVLGLLALAYVLSPLIRRPAPRSAASTLASNVSEREQTARQVLQEVEFDYQLGNLDAQDYRSLRTRYIDRAAREMQRRHQQEEALDAQIEDELRKLKEAEDEMVDDGQS